MNCPKCDMANRRGSTTCGVCGAPLGAAHRGSSPTGQKPGHAKNAVRPASIPSAPALPAPGVRRGLQGVLRAKDPPMPNGSAAPLLCFLGIVALIVGIVWVRNRSAQSQRDAFAQVLQASLAWKNLPSAEWKDHPYRKGKVLFVDKAAGAVDDLQFDPRVALAYDRWEDFRATSPGEVGTIVFLEYSQEKVGWYTDGADALRWSAKVTVIDATIPAVVASTDVVGHDPLMFKTHREAASGSKPDVQVLKFLQEDFVVR